MPQLSSHARGPSSPTSAQGAPSAAHAYTWPPPGAQPSRWVSCAHHPLPASARRQLVCAAGWASGLGTRSLLSACPRCRDSSGYYPKPTCVCWDHWGFGGKSFGADEGLGCESTGFLPGLALPPCRLRGSEVVRAPTPRAVWAPFPSVNKDKAYPEAANHSLFRSPRASARSWWLAGAGVWCDGCVAALGAESFYAPPAPNMCDLDSGPARLPPTVGGKHLGGVGGHGCGDSGLPWGDSPSLATSPMGTLCFWAMYPRKEKTTKPEEKLVRELTDVVMTASLGNKTHVPAPCCRRGHSLPLSSMHPAGVRRALEGALPGAPWPLPWAAPQTGRCPGWPPSEWL